MNAIRPTRSRSPRLAELFASSLFAKSDCSAQTAAVTITAIKQMISRPAIPLLMWLSGNSSCNDLFFKKSYPNHSRQRKAKKPENFSYHAFPFPFSFSLYRPLRFSRPLVPSSAMPTLRPPFCAKNRTLTTFAGRPIPGITVLAFRHELKIIDKFEYSRYATLHIIHAFQAQ